MDNTKAYRPGMEPIWRVEMLGGLRVMGKNMTVSRFETRKVALLLTYLALSHERAHPREILAERLWPDEDPIATRDRFRQALSALRRLLQPPGSPEGSVLAADRSGVQFVPGSISTDVTDFAAAVKFLDSTVPPGDRATRLEQALGLYSGELLPGFYEDWIVVERERLAEFFRDALHRLAMLREQDGQFESAVELYRRVIAEDPLREDSHTALMRAYTAAGRNSEALRHYGTMERILMEQVGSLPSPATQALLAQLRSRGNPAPIIASLQLSSQSSTLMPAPGPRLPLESEGGAVPLESHFYLVRPTDQLFRNAIQRRDSIVLVKGARQMGKTSLLARGLHQARQEGASVVLTDLQKLTAEQMETAETLFFSLAEMIAEQLRLDIDIESFWRTPRGWNVKFERFMRREALANPQTHIVWGLDEADRLFGRPYCTEVFGLFRSWHNERSLNPEGPWSRLTLAIAYATEAHLFITDLNQSPFNVGTRVTMDDFTLAEVAEVNWRYGAPLRTEAEVSRFFATVGGHPYLVRRGLHAISSQGLDIDAFDASASEENGVFSDHLRRMLSGLRHDIMLSIAVRDFLRDEQRLDPDSFYRLHSAGILLGRSEQDARVRCRLYGEYLRRHLL